MRCDSREAARLHHHARGDRSRSPDDRLVFVINSQSNELTDNPRDREMKDDRDDVRENGTNGEDRKGVISITMRIHN